MFVSWLHHIISITRPVRAAAAAMLKVQMSYRNSETMTARNLCLSSRWRQFAVAVIDGYAVCAMVICTRLDGQTVISPTLCSSSVCIRLEYRPQATFRFAQQMNTPADTFILAHTGGWFQPTGSSACMPSS